MLKALCGRQDSSGSGHFSQSGHEERITVEFQTKRRNEVQRRCWNRKTIENEQTEQGCRGDAHPGQQAPFEGDWVLERRLSFRLRAPARALRLTGGPSSQSARPPIFFQGEPGTCRGAHRARPRHANAEEIAMRRKSSTVVPADPCRIDRS
jgi:hypothetical protein